MQAINNIQQVARFVLIAFVLTAFSLIFWSVFRADDILTREDNPRQVDAALQIQRGQIIDKNGRSLAETVGPQDDLRRHYPLSAIGPAVGYYSFRHGTDGVEDSYNAILRGDSNNGWEELWRLALHEPQVGQDVRITLDADMQMLADSLMEEHKGALILFSQSGQSADVVSLVSHPGYDPNQLRERFEELMADEEAPLLNRITQGQYQPGMVLQPFILAFADDQGYLSLADTIAHPNRPVLINDTATYCASTSPEPASWQDVLANRCPGPMLDLTDTLSLNDLNNAFDSFNLTSQPELPLNTETATFPPLADPAQALIGQDNLIVTPLQIAVAWLALNNNGRFPPLRLVTHIQNEAGDWELVDTEAEGNGETAVSPQTAANILQSLPRTDGITEFSTLVLSGPDGTTHTWYLGATASGETVVIVLEDEVNLEEVEEIGRKLLTAVQN
jgi:peptidoglycan glycosyltransferase